MENGASTDLLERVPVRSGKRIALVGSGPASLACGGTLALLGHDAVLFERHARPGGLNTTGVAPYKLEARSALAEVEFVRSLGLEIRTGVQIGRDVSPEALLAEFDAVFLGPGLGADSRLEAEGAEGAGVHGAVEWIERMKLDPAASVDGVRRAAVIGGGNTAIDAARELHVVGVPHVTLVYRRRERDMSGYAHEWSAARREGIDMIEDALVGAVRRDAAGRPTELALVRAKDGRPTGEALPPLPVDLVLVATGQARLRQLAESFEGVRCDERGRIIADPETGRTGNPRVYCGGDARNGGKEVVNAVDEGQRAARAIDAALRAHQHSR